MKPTVLLLHGFPLDARMWEGQRAALEGAGHTAVAPDLPGPEPELGVQRWARRVLGLVEGPFVTVGVSMGGYLAFELWRQAPQRIPALVLADTRATPDTPEQREARDDAISLLGEGGFAPFWEALAPKLFSVHVEPTVVERARELAAEQQLTGLVSALETLRDRPDSRSTLASIDVPVLVVVGEEDALTPPADSDALAAALPDARTVRIAGAGHLTPLERPDEFNDALLGFLDEVVA
jgi:3-oxoadipate enol-lactonase